MKFIMKIHKFLIIIALLILIVLLPSCAKNIDDDTGKIEIIKDGASKFTVYFPRTAKDDVINAAFKLKDNIAEKTGFLLNFKNDSFEPDAERPYEILIGNTNRAETKLTLEELGKYDFTVRIVNGKLIIAGGSDRKTLEAIEYFAENFLTENGIEITANFNYTSTNTGEGEKIMHAFTNPIAQSGNDPWLIFHDGYYYYCLSAKGGVCVARIENIYELDSAKPVKIWTPPEGTMYSKELWAPELHYLDGEWYIYVAADDGNNDNHRMYVLKGTTQDPTDEFIFMGQITDETNKWAIDGTVMQYKDKMYFVWSGWRDNVNVAQHIYIAEMSDPCTISSSRMKISSPELSWELIGNPTINEGPVAIEHNGTMHIVYSASGSWTDDYCLGLLTLAGDDPLSPDSWVKSDKPILSKSKTVFGPGHCSFTTSPDGKETWVIYHANEVSGSGWSGRKSWAQPVAWDENNYPVIGKPADPGKELEIAVNE